MRILSRQFLASYLGLYLAILVASLLVIGIIEMMVNFDNAMEFSEGLLGIGTYLFLRLPSYYLPYLIPVSSFAAAFFCLGLPARTQEIVAIKAGGIAPQRICLPVLVAAGVLTLVTFVMNETIVRESTNQYKREKHGDSEALFPVRGAFWYHRGAYLYNVREADSDTRTLYGVRVYERTPDGRLLRSITATSAQISDDHRWQLHDAVFRSFQPEAPEAPPEVRREATAVLDVASERELALLDANAATLSLPRLLEYIEARRGEGRSVTRYRALFHSRLADPLSVIVFALLAIPLGLAVERSRSLATAAVQGIALIGVFYTLQTAAAMVAAGGVAAAVTAPWILLGLFAIWGAWRFARLPA